VSKLLSRRTVARRLKEVCWEYPHLGAPQGKANARRRPDGSIIYTDIHGNRYEIPKAEITLARKYVNKGAALLDEKLPGWHRSIAQEYLRLDSCDLCVCGQLALASKMEPDSLGSSFANMLRRLGCYKSNGERHGFDRTSKVSYAALEVAWHELIDKRIKAEEKAKA
jgi:hypothetical protein